LNVPCVASRTRWLYLFLSSIPRATKGCTSPRDPTTCITIFNGGGASEDEAAAYVVSGGVGV
jgi:hypothetical protein